MPNISRHKLNRQSNSSRRRLFILISIFFYMLHNIWEIYVTRSLRTPAGIDKNLQPKALMSCPDQKNDNNSKLPFSIIYIYHPINMCMSLPLSCPKNKGWNYIFMFVATTNVHTLCVWITCQFLFIKFQKVYLNQINQKTALFLLLNPNYYSYVYTLHIHRTKKRVMI